MTNRESLGDRQTIARIVMIAGVSLGLSIGTAAMAEEFDGPRFQRGMWQFERTLAHVGSSPTLPADTFMLKQQVERCVDPTEAMKETFRPTVVGGCRSVRPERIDNRYVFSLRCDFMGPARTVIEVESATAYTEVNEFSAGKPKKIETVTARRIGDCGEQSVIAAVPVPLAVPLPLPRPNGWALAGEGTEVRLPARRDVGQAVGR